MTAEIMEFIGKTDKNGNTARLRVDVANRKFYRDFVSFYGEPIKVEKSAISEEAEPDDWSTVNVYRLFDGFKAETIIDTINEYWQIEIAELEV